MGHLEHGRESCGRRAWGEAYDALRCADRDAPLDVDDLDLFATAAYLSGRDDEFEQILERLYRLHIESGDRARGARAAFWLALMLLLRGESGRSSAWTARCQRLIEGADCVEQAHLAIIVSEQQLRGGQAAEAHATATRAVAIGEEFRVSTSPPPAATSRVGR